MAALRYGKVTYKDIPVGTLRETPGGGSVFAYDEGVTMPIACALPIAQREHATPFGLHPFFAHLAPEGWLRDRQTAFADVDKNDDFGILLAFGADCIGAVGIVDPANSHRRVSLTAACDPLDAAAVNVERTISGVQAKVLCAANGQGGYRPASAGEPAPYIAKYPQPPLTGMAANEATTLELCRILLGAPEVVVGDLAAVDGIDGLALVVERFDRAGLGHRDKLRCEEFAQVIAQLPGLDHRGKYEVGYDALGRALAFSSARLLDARRLFKRLAAYVLVGNVDCHLKNFALVETAEGLRLAPAYDILNGYIYGDTGYTTRFGLTLDGQRRQWQDYDRALLLAIAGEFGLGRRAAEGVLKELASRKTAFDKRLERGLRLNEERSWAYRNAAREAWERLHG